MKLISKLRLKFDNPSKVNLFIIGAQKSGTTSLYYYLSQHNSIKGSIPKEVDFFSYDKNYSKGNEWYHSHFENAVNSRRFYYLDASVEYMYIPGTWKRIKKYNPDAKIIVLLRDPVERAYSAYYMYKRLNEGYGIGYYEEHIQNHNPYYKSQMLNLLKSGVFLSFEEYIKIEMGLHQKMNERFWYEPSFLNRGIYVKQLTPYFENFDSNNILIVDSAKFKVNKSMVLNDIFDWLELNKKGDYDLKKEYLVGDYKKSKNDELDHKIRGFFQNYNERLFELIKEDFNW